MAIFRFEHEGRTVLGFGSGLSSAEFARQRSASLLEETGFILAGSPFQAAIWRPAGVIERDKEMVIWGENVTGRALLDIVTEKQAENETVERSLTLFLRAMAFKNSNETGYSPSGVFVDLKTDSVFLPPPPLVKAANTESEDVWLENSERWVHPGLRGNKAAIFTVSSLLYAYLAGFPPFNVPHKTAPGGPEAEDILHADIREAVFVPLRLAAPACNAKLAAQVDAGLSGNTEDTPDFSLLRRPEAEPDKNAASERRAFQERQRKQVRRRRFLRRNRNALAAAGVALAVAGIVAGSFVNTLSKRPTTEGLSPQEVVLAYYSAFSSLDQDMMSACVTGSAGKNDLNAAAYIFVTDRTREAYEGRSFLYSAEEYVAGGRPPEGTRVFGIADLEVSEARFSSDDQVTIQAKYTLYTPFAPQTAPQPPDSGPPDEGEIYDTSPHGENWADTLSLVQKKGRWRIEKITREAG